MIRLQTTSRHQGAIVCATVFVVIAGFSGLAQQAPLPTPAIPPSNPSSMAPPSYPPAELERIVSPIALYPDPLLVQVLAAATYPAEIPEATRWADDHHYLNGKALTDAMTADRLPWDPSVQALLAFPSVLEMMASAMAWTEELGDAFLAQRDQVMDAVQRLRQTAQQTGYLRSNAQLTVNRGPYIEILPVDPYYMPVPYYDPYVVFWPATPGLVVGAVYLGFGVRLGPWWGPWGWGTTHFAWPTHGVIIGNVPWARTWPNHVGYVHPYPGVPRHPGPRLPDVHRAVPRTPTERAFPRGGAGRGSAARRR